MGPFKYLSNFWKTLGTLLTNCKVNLMLTWFETCLLSNSANQATEFAITYTKLYVLIVTLSTQYSAKLLQ